MDLNRLPLFVGSCDQPCEWFHWLAIQIHLGLNTFTVIIHYGNCAGTRSRPVILYQSDGSYSPKPVGEYSPQIDMIVRLPMVIFEGACDQVGFGAW